MKRAFSFLELTLVIVIIGIISSIALPKLKSDPLAILSEQILMHIRYTQHLAMQDSKVKIGENWQRKRWSIVFANSELKTKSCNIDTGKTWKYYIYWDDSLSGNLNSGQEVARNPLKSHMYLSPGWSGISAKDCKFISRELNIGKVYGIVDVKFEGECSKDRSKTISFDEFGRPMRVVSTTSNGAQRGYDRLLKSDCKIILATQTNKISIRVSHRTGFVCLLDKDGKNCKI